MLRVACDVDGTLADINGALQLEVERLFGPGVDMAGSQRNQQHDHTAADTTDPTPPNRHPRQAATPPHGAWLTDRQQRRLWAHVRQINNFWMSLKEIEPGAVASLAQMASANDWEVIFLTQRPPSAGATSQVQSQRWLEAHGFELPSVYVVSGSRGKIAAALTLDAVLDDRPENCLDVVIDSKAKPFLIWRDTPDCVPPVALRFGINVVFSIAEALQQLEAAQVPDRRSGIVERLRQTLGI